MQNRIQEIESFLRHHDHSLAVRRMLDLSRDTGHVDLMKEALTWSKKYRAFLNEGPDLPPSFYGGAAHLLERLSATGEGLPDQRRQLLSAAGISKQYARGGFSLQPISLEVATGDILGVVGENG